MRRVLVVLCFSLACSEPQSPAPPQNPTAPQSPATPAACSVGHGQPFNGIDFPVCQPRGNEISCTVTAWKAATTPPCTVFGYDATAVATWSVDATYFEIPPKPSSVAIVSSPGVITPVQRGNIAIRAEVDGARTWYRRTFAVDPGAPPIALCPYIGGEVFGSDGTSLTGVLAEIVDGPDAGKTNDPNFVNPYGYHIYHVRMGVAFTMRISKPGYVTKLVLHPALVAEGEGLPGPVFLDVTLLKAD